MKREVGEESRDTEQERSVMFGIYETYTKMFPLTGFGVVLLLKTNGFSTFAIL